MTHIVPITEITSLGPVASDFNQLLSIPDNQDIKLDFPDTVRRYTGRHVAVLGELLLTASACKQRSDKQQFVTFVDGQAVGLSAIQRVSDNPSMVDPNSPVLTAFVCHPYRWQRLGMLSLRTLLAYADSHFDGQAWTKVRQANKASWALMHKAGLHPAHEDTDYKFFTYSSS